jgi:hypothetical protein
MKQILVSAILVSFLFSCKPKQADRIINKTDNNIIKFDISLVDSMIKQELQSVDTSFFNKYIAKNPVILGQNFDSPRLYADGFWIKKYADSIKHNIIFNSFRKSQYFIVPNPLKLKEVNDYFILVVYPSESIQIEGHIALYMITLDKKDFSPSTVLLAEKIKGGGLSSIDLTTTSVLKDSSIIEQRTIEQSCILDLPGPNGEITCNYDTTTTYYKMTDRHVFYPFKRIVSWEIRNNK